MSRSAPSAHRPAARPRRVTLRDVAALVGVDPSAVSRVVNNDTRVSVSDATRAEYGGGGKARLPP